MSDANLRGSAVMGAGADARDTGSSKRVYQVWRGSNRFFLGGRLVFGPDARSLLFTSTMILAPVAVFCVFVGRHLVKDFSHHSGVVIMVAAVANTCIVMVFLMLTSGRDPGIIPPNLHPPEPEEDGSSSSDWNGGQTPKLRLPRTKDVLVNGVVVKTKYCDTCMLYRPPRCSHCSICNNCVERFDHHCPWVGQCIGQRNYPSFFSFVLSATLLCLFIFAMCALRIKKLMDGDPPMTVGKALRKSPASAFLMAYAFLSTWFVGGLTVFHLYLISTNQTTYENFRYRYDKRINPFNRGTLGNFKEVLFSGIPASKVNFRAKAPREALSFGNFSSQHRATNTMHMEGLKNEQARGDIKISGGKPPWAPSPLPMPGKSVQSISGSTNTSQMSIERGRHSYPADLSGSLFHEHSGGKGGEVSGKAAEVDNTLNLGGSHRTHGSLIGRSKS